MQHAVALLEQIKALKAIAASMQEGRIHTQLIPEIDKILALPDDVSAATVGEREAIARQVREYEQTFDSLGYSLLDQLMPATGVSNVFRIVQAADDFKVDLKRRVGRPVELDGKPQAFESHHLEALSRYSLSIGTPPVTDAMRELVARVVFGKDCKALYGYLETLSADPAALAMLLDLFGELVDSSLHYNTAAEEKSFLAEAGEFVNFEGASLFNRVVVTESPDRVIDLIANHVFDKFGPAGSTPVRLVAGVDKLDDELLARMRAEPNQVFVARVTRIPHGVFSPDPGAASQWRGVLGRLLLIDCSRKARLSNTTVVYTLFPHVARTLRNVQTSFSGRPANTQLLLRRILERFPAPLLDSLAASLEQGADLLEAQGVLTASIDAIRAQEWRRNDLFDYLTLRKMQRMVRFLARLAHADDAARKVLSDELEQRVAARWMKYFYGGLDPAQYKVAVVPGGGRGALTLVGEYHREAVREAVERFQIEKLPACRARLHELKRELGIPGESSDEIQAAIKQSQLLSLAPSQWNASKLDVSRSDYLARTLLYRAAEAASKFTKRAEQRLDKAAFGNLTGGAAAMLKDTMGKAGLSALHGHLEERVGGPLSKMDRKVRQLIAPVQDAVRSAQRRMDDLKGEMDPTAVGEVEALLKVIERGAFYPTLLLPQMSWSYQDVFPEKYFPAASTIRVPLNGDKEMDPLALLTRLEELRYSLRRFPEIFELWCRSMLLVVNTPHNPTGVAYRRETTLKLLQIASAYGITVCDDNAYHKLVTKDHKAREGDRSIAQLYEQHRDQFSRPVRLITVGATTKGLQGSGDRTGLVHSNVAEAVEMVRKRASAPHLMSLYLTELKLESGQAVKRYTKALEKIAGELVDPTKTQPAWASLKELLQESLAHASGQDFPVAVFETLLAGYEELLRLEARGASVKHLSEALSGLVRELKQLRLEVRLRGDVQKRIDALIAAHGKAMGDAELIEPNGAFYACLRLTAEGDERGVHEFLRAIARYRKVDVTYAGQGYVRVSLGGRLLGDAKGYARFQNALEVYLGLLKRYWAEYEKLGRDPSRLPGLFGAGKDELSSLLADLSPLLAQEPKRKAALGTPVRPSERGIVYCIEEGKSVADKVFVEWRPCETVDELLHARTFRVLYRRLLRKVCRRHPELMDLTFAEVENQYGPLACLAAYHDRQLIDPVFRQLLADLYAEWHSASITKVLTARFEQGSQNEKVAALNGLHRRTNDLINELMHAFEIPDAKVKATTTFEIGYEALDGVRAHAGLPGYLRRLIEGSTFSGVTAALDPAPSFVTGAAKRVSDYRYGFTRREGEAGVAGAVKPDLAFFQRRLARFAQTADLSSYVCKAVPVGPFKMLVVIHKSCLHLISDEMRLFPQIPEMQLRERVDAADWDAVLLFGIPAKGMGESYKTGYVLDQKADGRLLPTAWVAREDDTDYVGFFKKSLLTLHNELVKAMGGMPVHGAMITITFKNGLRKTLVFSADSGTGKSETITAMMDQLASGEAVAAEVKRVDILAGDMLSLWRGEDEQVYAFGTEQGDFLRLNDITESWKARFGDLLKRGSYSNLDHPKNPRVTIPGICDPRKFLSPTRVNGFFYINNYEGVKASAVELSDDPHHVLKNTLVRGLRKNKGTSGDQPSLRAGLEFAGKTALVVRFRHSLDELLDWQDRKLDGEAQTCLCYRDGAQDVFTAREMVAAAFTGESFDKKGRRLTVEAVEYDVLQNLYWLRCGQERVALSRAVYDQIYQPLVATFCGNPFVEPDGMDKVLEVFADTMRLAKVHTGVIKTQLAREGYEFSGPGRAAKDIIGFLLEDEEVSARFQRNKDKVHQAMARTFGGVLELGANLPVELEGYNLLLLEAHESTHVAFRDLAARQFALSTPYYRFDPHATGASRPFAPAIAVPEMVAAIADICANPDHGFDLSGFTVELGDYERIRYWNTREELVYQVLLVNEVISIGSSEGEVQRFPSEVRKADYLASQILAARQPELGTFVPKFRVVAAP